MSSTGTFTHLHSPVARYDLRDCVECRIHCPVLPSPWICNCGQLQQNIAGGFMFMYQFDAQRCQDVKEDGGKEF